MNSYFERSEFHPLIEDAAKRHEVPGASFAIWIRGEVKEAATGVLSTATGVEATEDSVFQIGSISKVYTATLAMQLVDEGKVGLDDPVKVVLPEFQVADPDVTGRVTLRHLLCHTSGIDGDFFADTGRGDDCLEKYVGACASLDQIHILGATTSYCIAGFIVVGRMVEVLTGQIWDQALRERLAQPLRLKDTVTLPEEAILRRTASGHSLSPGEKDPTPSPTWGLPRSLGPAGLICATARDVIIFARLHLDLGLTPDRTPVLSAESVAAMQEMQVDTPGRWTFRDQWGLGWTLMTWDGRRVIGHDGTTIGQSAFLRIIPEENLAVALLTNGGNARAMFQEVCEAVFPALGVSVPSPPDVPSTTMPELDIEPYLGRYERLGRTTVVQRTKEGKLELVVESHGKLAELIAHPKQTFALYPVDRELFLAVTRKTDLPIPVVFFAFEGDRPDYLHMRARANRRTSMEASHGPQR